ncbi:MAG: hypothetical protein LBK02_02665, partial [Treponema sp.]|nr:hypothetical protein [Treponema sp.]
NAFAESLPPEMVDGSVKTARGTAAAKNTAVWAARVDAIAVAAENLRQAEAKSGYRFDKLLEALSGKKPAKTVKSKKTAVKKPK